MRIRGRMKPISSKDLKTIDIEDSNHMRFAVAGVVLNADRLVDL